MSRRICFVLLCAAVFPYGAYSQAVNAGGVVNAGSNQTPVAPGSVITIYGTKLAGASAGALSVPLPLSLGGTTVVVNGTLLAPLFYVSPGQVNAQLPFETPPGTATVSVNGSAPVSFPVAATAPGIFVYGSNRAVVINPDLSVNSPEHPAAGNTVVTVYMTGQGAVDPLVPTGTSAPGNPLALPVAPVTATIGGHPAEVKFAGLTPGGVALFQVNLLIPQSVTGDLPLVVSVGGVPSNAPLIAVSGDGRPVSTVVRTMVYHQLTSLPDNGPDNRSSTVISGDGKVIAYTYAPGSTKSVNKIYMMNFDGSGDHLVDSYVPGWNSGSILDISDDGTKLVSTEGRQIRIVDRGAVQTLITVDAVISGLKISGDGRRVFFLVHRDGYVTGGSKPVPIQRGLYVMGADGSGARQIVGPNAVAGLFGTTVSDSISPEFTVTGNAANHSLSASRDGSFIAFGARKRAGYGPDAIFGVKADGSGLHLILGPVPYVGHLAMSADGSKVLYDTTSSDFVVETGVVNFDGGGRRALRHDGLGNSPGVQLNADGSLALAFDILYSTDGSGALQLTTSYNSLTRGNPVMNSNATRFVYSFVPPGTYSIGLSQLASLEINPLSLGAAPAISSPSVDPPYAVAGGSAKSTASVTVSPHDNVIAVSYAILDDGLVEDSANGDAFLVDNGTQGDRAVEDGVFTSNNIIAASRSPEGIRLLRLFAQVFDAKKWRHATLIDVTPFAVVLKPAK